MHWSYSNYRTILSCFCISFLFLVSCNPDQKKFNSTSTASKVDSLFDLIQEGRNTELSYDSRTTQLNQVWKEIPNLENDSSKTKLYSRLSLAFLRLGDSSSFRETNSKAMSLARQTDDSTTLAESNWDLAEFYGARTFSDSAYFHYSEAQKIYQFLNDDFQSGTMLNNMAITQADVKDYTGSEITTIRAIEILKPLQADYQLSMSYTNLGSITKELNEYERSLEFYQETLKYQEKLQNNTLLILGTKNNIGIVYQNQGKYEESIPYFQEVINNQTLQEKNPELYALALNNLAYSKSKIEQSTSQSTQFEKAIQIQNKLNDISGLSASHYNFSDYYLDRRDTLSALNEAKKALNYAERADNNDRILQTLLLLTKVNPTNSSDYNQRYINLNDSLQEEERQIRDKFARIRFETDEYIAENEELANEKQLWAGIAFAIFLLGASAIVIFNQRARNQKLRFQQAQQSANQEIFNLMLAQKEKEEEGKKSEQKRISEELHDGVLGRMMGARLVLTGLNQKSGEEAEVNRSKAIDALQDVEKEIRSISHELSHAAYRKIHNFILSLQELLITVQSASDINCHLIYDEKKNWDALQGEVKINVYRMVQESLQNSVKHAQCRNATVTLGMQQNLLKVEIADDGRGFNQKRKKKGIGMRNIASRVKKLNGKWQIDSIPEKGTNVVLQIPINKPKKLNPSKNIEKTELSEQV